MSAEATEGQESLKEQLLAVHVHGTTVAALLQVVSTDKNETYVGVSQSGVVYVQQIGPRHSLLVTLNAVLTEITLNVNGKKLPEQFKLDEPSARERLHRKLASKILRNIHRTNKSAAVARRTRIVN